MGRVVLTASGKGGVGKSVFTSNLGCIFAERGLKVALIDMNVGLRNLDIYMGLENRVIFDVADVLDGVVSPRKAMVKDRRFQGLYLLATTQKKEKFTADAERIAAFYRFLKERFDIIIVDGPAGVGEELKRISSGTDMTVLVTTPEHVSLRDADLVDQSLRTYGIARRVYVVNKFNKAFLASGVLPTVETITGMMKIPLIGVVQYDDLIHIAANTGNPAVTQGDSYITGNFEKIADRLLAY